MLLSPGAPGLLRRPAGSGRLGHADHDVHRPERTGAGLRHLRRHFRRRRRPRLLLGGILTSYASWRWTLFVNVAIGAVAIAGAARLLSNSRAANRPRLDLLRCHHRQHRAVRPGLRVLPRPRPPRGGTGTPSPAWWPPPCCLPSSSPSSDGWSQPLLPLRMRGQPQPGRCLHRRVHGRDRVVRHVLIPHLLHAGHAPLLPRPDRRRLTCR